MLAVSDACRYIPQPVYTQRLHPVRSYIRRAGLERDTPTEGVGGDTAWPRNVLVQRIAESDRRRHCTSRCALLDREAFSALDGGVHDSSSGSIISVFFVDVDVEMPGRPVLDGLAEVPDDSTGKADG